MKEEMKEEIYCTIWTKDGSQKLTRRQYWDFDWDKLHHLGRPAVEYTDGSSKEWWIDGEELDTEEVELWIEENNIDLKTQEDQMAFKLRWIS